MGDRFFYIKKHSSLIELFDIVIKLENTFILKFYPLRYIFFINISLIYPNEYKVGEKNIL